MKREYRYLISYNYKGGRGQALVKLKKPITSFKQIMELSGEIEKEQDIQNALIGNYILVSKRDKVRKFI